jgi:hypothetical protein
VSAPPEAEETPWGVDEFLNTFDFGALAGSIDIDGIQKAMNEMLGGSGGSGGGSGSGSGSGSADGTGGKKGGKGGGGGGWADNKWDQGTLRTALADYLTSQMNVDPAELYQLDPALGDEAKDIRARLEADRGKLYDLDPEARAAYEQQLAAETALLERNFNEQRSSYLAGIFGTGMEQSTFALDQGGRLIGDQQLTLQQARAQNQMQQLQQRGMITELGQQNLAMQMEGLNQQRQAQLNLFGIQQQHRASAIGMAAQMQSSFLSRDAAYRNAAAQVKSAGLAASAQKYAAEVSAEARVKAAGISASAQKYATNAGLFSSLYGTTTGMRQHEAEVDWRYYNTDTGADTAKYQADMQMKIAEMQQPSMFDKILGAAAGGASAYFSGGFLKGG